MKTLSHMKNMFRLNKMILLGLMLAFGITAPIAKEKDPARVIAGWVENVAVENQGFEVKAKLDTGAMTSSIHALNIESFKKGDDDYVRFDLPLTDKHGELHTLSFEKPRTRKVKIKNHDGRHDKRYVVKLELCFNGINYPVQFTLVDRGQFNYNILLGRRFLGKVAIIDPAKTFLTTAVCKQ